MKLVALREVASIQLGKMLSPKAKTGQDPYPYLRNQNVQWGRFDLDDLAVMDFNARDRQKFELHDGDLLVCEGGEPGRCAVWRGEIESCYYQKAIHRVRPIEAVAHSDFLAMWIRFQALRGAFNDQNLKTTIAHLPLVRLEQMLVPAISIQEQREIVARLNAQLAEAEAIQQAARRRLNEVGNLINAVIRRSADHSGAETVVLGDVVRIDARIVDPTDPALSILPHVSAENIRPVTGELHNVRSAAEDGMESGKYLFDIGDVLYSKLRPYLRKVAVVTFAGLCSADMYPLKFDKDRVDADYLRALLVSDAFTLYAGEMSARSRMPKLNREQLFAFEFKLPSIDEQRHIATHTNTQLEKYPLCSKPPPHNRQKSNACPNVCSPKPSRCKYDPSEQDR
jgi:type I restriction enzyme S subunit